MSEPVTYADQSVAELEARRQRLAEQMLAIRAVQPGKISEQFLKVPHKGKSEPVKRGPYYVLTWWENGRTRSRRIKPEDLERTREEVANYARLKALCQEFEQITQALGEAERRQSDSEEALKKGVKPQPKRAKRPGG